MSDKLANPERGAGMLVIAVCLTAGCAFLLVMQLLWGPGQCGPPGHSAESHWTTASAFLIPALGVGILIAIGAIRRWRLSTRLWGALATVAIGGMLELGIAFIDIGTHGCFK